MHEKNWANHAQSTPWAILRYILKVAWACAARAWIWRPRTQDAPLEMMKKMKGGGLMAEDFRALEAGKSII